MKDPATGVASKGPWTINEINASLSGAGGTRTENDLERLTPLPSASAPAAMFMGVTGADHEAVFAFATGVDATGQGRCEPSRDDCELVDLAHGQSEHLVYLLSDGTERTFTLTVHSVSSSVTTSATVAATALNRRSQIGLCEIQLGALVDFKYDATSGSVQSSTPTSACTRGMKAVPFPGAGL